MLHRFRVFASLYCSSWDLYCCLFLVILCCLSFGGRHLVKMSDAPCCVSYYLVEIERGFLFADHWDD